MSCTEVSIQNLRGYTLLKPNVSSDITRCNSDLYLQIYPKKPGVTILQCFYEKKPQCQKIQNIRLMFKNRVEVLP